MKCVRENKMPPRGTSKILPFAGKQASCRICSGLVPRHSDDSEQGRSFPDSNDSTAFAGSRARAPMGAVEQRLRFAFKLKSDDFEA